MNKNKQKVEELLKQITPTEEELRQKAEAKNEKQILQNVDLMLKQHDEERQLIKKANEGPKAKFFRKLAKHACNFIYGVSICSGILSAGTVLKQTYNSNRRFISTSGYTQQIAKELNTDLGLMNNLKFTGMENTQKGLTRLKPNITNKIYCYIDPNVPKEVRKNIEDSLEYFNDLFDFINDRYNFKLCSKERYLAHKFLSESTISFEMKTSEQLGDVNIQGLNMLKPNKNLISQMINNVDNVYIVDSSIYLNVEAFKQRLNDTEQRYVIKHEIMHSLGLGDMYDNAYFNDASIMNAGYDLTDNLSPNDMRLLFTAYHEKLVQNNAIDYTYLNKVKTLLDNYEEWYYKMVFEFCRPALGSNLKKISASEINSTIFQLPGKKGSLLVNDNNTFVSYYNGIETMSKAFVSDEYIICPNVQTGNGTKCYILTRAENGQVYCRDLISYSYCRPQVELVKNSNSDGLGVIVK